MSEHKKNKLSTATSTDVDQFLRKVARTPSPQGNASGRLIFSMDATASREPNWDLACHIQSAMFRETRNIGDLQVQLAYFHGYQQFHHSPWCPDTEQLLKHMTSVSCLGGMTQIEKVLRHTLAETRQQRVHALVFVGDCMEENIDHLSHLAGQLGMLGVPIFIFHEGNDPIAAAAFQYLSKLSGGAYCPFDVNSPQQLRDLLTAVAIYAVGGRKALEGFSAGGRSIVRQLSHQIKK